jgi:hypothetical protein
LPRAAKWDDAKWRGLNHELIEALRVSDWFHAHQIYFQQALYLENFKRDFSLPLKVSRECYVRHCMTQEFVTKVQIMTVGNSCDICNNLHGNRYSLKEALETSPLPCVQCANGLCRCLYTTVVE